MNRFRRMQSYYYVDNTDGHIVNPALPAMRDYSIYGSSIQDGTPTPDSPVEVQSVGDLVTEGEHAGKYKIPVNVRGRNLFDEETVLSQQGWVKQADGSWYVELASTPFQKTLWQNTEGYTGRIKLLWKFKYAKPYAEANAGVSIRRYYTDGTNDTIWLSFNNFEGNTWYSPNNAYVISNASKVVDRFDWAYGTGSNSTWVKDIIITKDLNVTDYEPYHEPSEAVIYLDEPLRKIGDKADYIDFANKRVVRNIGKSVLSPDGAYAYYLWSNRHGVMWNGLSEGGSLKNGLSNRENHFTQGGVDVHAMWLGVGNNPYIYWIGILDALNIYSAEKTNDEMKAEFKTWLENNPTYVCYPLNTPVSESVDLPAVKLGKNTNIITVGTDIQPSAVNWQYYKY